MGTVALGFFAVAVVVLVSGCGLFSERFDPHGAPATAARAHAVVLLDRYGPDFWGNGPGLARSESDRCHAGQNNWKVREGLDYQCKVTRGWVLDGARSNSEVRPLLVQLRDRLVAAGCTPWGTRGLETAIDYWDRKVQANPGRLPSEGYQCPDRVDVYVKLLDPSDQRVRPEGHVTSLTGGQVAVLTDNPFPADTAAKITAPGAVMRLSITAAKAYYEVA